MKKEGFLKAFLFAVFYRNYPAFAPVPVGFPRRKSLLFADGFRIINAIERKEGNTMLYAIATIIAPSFPVFC